MHKLIFTLAALAVLAGFSCSPRTEPSLVPAESTKPAVNTEDEDFGGPVEPHPVSLPALMNKDFYGHDFTVGRVLDDNSVYTRYYITYISGELKISGIMNVPKATPPAGGHPLLILNHGYIDTDIYTNGRGLKREQDYLVRQGFVIVHPDYRNHADSDDDADVETKFRLGYTEDVINAVLAIREAKLPYVNADKVGMMGHSMGGGVTQNVLIVKPDLVQAAVLYAPVSGDYKNNYERYTTRRPETLARIIATYGEITGNIEFWANLSASSFYDRIAAPVEIHIGTADESVEPEWSYAIQARLEWLGKPVVLHEYQGEHHEFSRDWTLMMSRIADFFTTELKTGAGTGETS